MGFELGVDPEIYIKRILVYTYIAKWLRSNEEGFKASLTIEHEARNLKNLLSQGGVSFIDRKVLKDTIYVKFRYKEKVRTVQFNKDSLIKEMEPAFLDLGRQGIIHLNIHGPKKIPRE